MDALRRLFVWWGWRRVVGVTVGVPVAVFAVWWMVRAPAPPVESQIPFAPVTTLASLVELGVGALAAGDLGAGSGAIASAPTTLVVHIVGAVQRPGVYELPIGARGDDAVRAAGGLTRDADIRLVNLALPLIDGGQLVVPRRGERPVVAPTQSATPQQPVRTASPTSPASPVRPASPATPAAAAAGPTNINRATAAELEALPGVGPSTARAIVEHRERYGPFATVDDLLAVRGIGPAKLAEMRSWVSVR